MNLYYENETEYSFDFNVEDNAIKVIEEALKLHSCPYDVEVSLYIVNNKEIHAINKENRNIDRPTDVLSFPGIEFENVADFSIIENAPTKFEYINPENGLLNLGEIIISYEKVEEQAKEYGHSIYRELLFLVTHSILHLLGYDHMEENERIEMENMQNIILNNLQIYR